MGSYGPDGFPYEFPIYWAYPAHSLFNKPTHYKERADPLNRVFVIGKDTDGNPVYGYAEDITSTVGERLEIKNCPELVDLADCNFVASAIQGKSRFNEAKGYIISPPNCGIELWDVIRIHDTVCAQSDKGYRVIGTKTVFNRKEKLCHQAILLGEI